MKRNDRPEAVTAILRHWREAVPDDRMAHLVKDVWRGLTRAFQVRLGEHDVLFGHWVFLRVLWESDGITQSELSERAGLMLPTTHAALTTMERLGYVRCERRPGDGRRVYVHLTPSGQAMRQPLVALAEEVNAIALDGVTPAEVGAARNTLLRMIENLAADEITLTQAERRIPSTRDLVRKTVAGTIDVAGAAPNACKRRVRKRRDVER